MTPLPKQPKRIVSLVPSDTYTLLRLGAGERLVGRTRYCVEPADPTPNIPEVGGTKDPDFERVLDLSPDLVVMNEEENTRPFYEKLVRAGVAVHSTIQKRLGDGLAQVGALGRFLGDLDADAKDHVRKAYAVARRAEERKLAPPVIRAFVPIWTDPWMTIRGDTFISDVLACAGAINVFEDRSRRFPLAADIHGAPQLPDEKTAGRDARYPRINLDELRERAPELMLLPDEPHPFGEAEVTTLQALALTAPENVRLCTGKHLMWPGLMSLEHHEHVHSLVADAARIASERGRR